MTLWRWCAASALVVIAVAMAFGRISNIDACYTTPLGAAWVTLQRAQNAADVAAVIRPGCAQLLLPALQKSMLLDAVAFIPAYVSFLLTALLALRPVTGGTLPKIGFGALLLGALFDQAEGISLLTIINALPGSAGQFTVLSLSYTGKMFFLGLTSLIIGRMFWAKAGWWRAIGGIIGVAGAASMTVPLFGDALSNRGLSISWTMLALTAFTLALRRSVQP